MFISPFQFRSAFSRGLGLLLIAFILYGTTVEAAHRHGGRVLPPSGSNATSLSHSEQPANPVSKTTGCHDCLLCQLHQNLNTSLIAYRIVDPPQQLQVRVPVTALRDVFSQSASATAGRAPPFIS